MKNKALTMAHISLKNVTVNFPVYGANTRSLKKSLVRITTGGILKESDSSVITVCALNNLSFDIKSGERIGLIGHNGAGKSTLLRLLSRIYEPVAGKIAIQGKVTALLDVMLGMDLESTGYENILLRGMLQGLTRKEILAKQEEIAEFTELGSYLNMPVRTYSSGMQLRLAFAIATSIQAEILILDEVIGTGDAGFLEKAKNRMLQMIHNSDIVIIASHDIEVLKSLCTKVLWLNAGKMEFFGDIQEGLKQYLNKIHHQ